MRALEGVDAVRVSAARYHALAVSRDGRVYTWGGGLYGQLGHGDRYPRFEPTLVAALARVNITDAVAGTRHTVAVAIWAKSTRGVPTSLASWAWTRGR